MGLSLSGADMIPSFTLGSALVSPLEMAEAYATFAARGMHCDAHPVTRILDRHGKPLPITQPRCEQVIPKKVADAVNDVLRGVLEPGGFGEGLALNQPSAGKTGTTSNNKAVWFVGYTPDLSAAAMVGGANMQGSLVTLNQQTIGGLTIDTAFGSTVAGPIWADAMRAIEGMVPDKDFVPPDPETVEGDTLTVPALCGFSLEHAQQVLKKIGFTPTVAYTVDSRFPYGTVAYTEPEAYSQLGKGSSVLIYLSDGTPAKPSASPSGSPTSSPTSSPTR